MSACITTAAFLSGVCRIDTTAETKDWNNIPVTSFNASSGPLRFNCVIWGKPKWMDSVVLTKGSYVFLAGQFTKEDTVQVKCATCIEAAPASEESCIEDTDDADVEF